MSALGSAEIRLFEGHVVSWANKPAAAAATWRQRAISSGIAEL
jgi:hypothetical protein